MTDLLDRVAAANPVASGTELAPAERRAADALRERVPAIPPEAPRRRPRRRHRLVLAGVAAAALILAAVVTSVLDRGPSVAERAYAAISGPSLYHVVSTTTVDAPAALRASGLESGEAATEVWYDLERPAYHALNYDDEGDLIREEAGSPAGTTVREPGDRAARPVEQLPEGGPPDVERFDPTALFKAAYRAGDVREDGMVDVGGRRAHRLVVDRAAAPDMGPGLRVRSSRVTALFDAETMYPIEFVDQSELELDGRRSRVVWRVRYETFETLPRTAENVAKLRMPARR